MPLVSVVMSVHNGEKYLSSAVESILLQSFRDLEFVIVNDGSTDRTGQFLDKLLSTDRRVRLISGPNRGLTKSLNLAINASDSKYVARMDADDRSYRRRIEIQIDCLEKSSARVGLCCSRARIMFSSEIVPKYPIFFAKSHLLPIFNPYIHGTFVMTRTALTEIGLYDESFPVAQDYKLLYDLEAFGYSTVYLSKPLYELRLHDESISRMRTSDQEAYAAKVRDLFEKRRWHPKTVILRQTQRVLTIGRS